MAEFHLGDLVRKRSGAEWEGTIVGTYSTRLTQEGYAVESGEHAGSVQIYPAAALVLLRAAQQPKPEAASSDYWVWQHIKSGGEYQLLGNAHVQTDAPLSDMAEVYIYQGDDHRMWVRPLAEFDARFKRVRPLATPYPTAAASQGEPSAASDLLRRAAKQIERWSEKYGEHNPDWLPPAGDVRLLEDIAEFLAAPASAASNGVTFTRLGDFLVAVTRKNADGQILDTLWQLPDDQLAALKAAGFGDTQQREAEIDKALGIERGAAPVVAEPPGDLVQWLEDLRPLVEYGRVGTRDVEQAKLQRALEGAIQAARQQQSDALGTHPSADKLDAERWRELRRQHEGDEARALNVFGPDDYCGLEPVGSMPGELDAAIDVAIKEQEKRT